MIRRFTAAVLAAVLLAGCGAGKAPGPVQPEPVTPQPAQAPYDLVLKGGTIVDGSGKSGIVGDVAVLGDKIVAVGKLGKYQAKQEIDVSGLMLAPGFINPHSHTHDFINPYDDYEATASLMQGITTEFGGVDGRSPLPVGAELKRIEGTGTGVNFGLFVGQGSVRQQVMGQAWAAASPQQLDQMKVIVRQSMEEGAFGVSSGLEYNPGKFAKQDEVTALVAESKPHGGIYSTHLRSEGAQIVESLTEALAIAKEADVPVNLSHFKIVRHENWDKLDQVVSLINQARKQGQHVFADVYPYLAPDYAINRPLKEWLGALPPEYILITRSADKAIVGKTIAEAAKSMDLAPDAAAQKLLATDPNMTIVALITSEKAMIRFYQSDWAVVSTDGESQPKLDDPVAALQFHPRSYGSYPRLLGHYVREKQIMPLEAMVRKMSGAVADNLGLKDRGYLKPGYFADIVVFGADQVNDRTSWLSPQEYPVGVKHVLVNGQMAIQDGQRLEGRPGRILRRGQ